jgi:hypothetical protein
MTRAEFVTMSVDKATSIGMQYSAMGVGEDGACKAIAAWTLQWQQDNHASDGECIQLLNAGTEGYAREVV